MSPFKIVAAGVVALSFSVAAWAQSPIVIKFSHGISDFIYTVIRRQRVYIIDIAIQVYNKTTFPVRPSIIISGGNEIY